jgi:hypothetical protein
MAERLPEVAGVGAVVVNTGFLVSGFLDRTGNHRESKNSEIWANLAAKPAIYPYTREKTLKSPLRPG